MGLSHSKRYKGESRKPCMDHKRNFGTPSGQLTEREPLNTDLFMRVGTITAYYEHVTPSTVVPSTTNPFGPPVPIPVVSTVPALCEQTAPVTPIYDTPTKLNEPSSRFYLPIVDPDVLLEGCETLLRSLLQRIVERYINGYSNYTDDAGVARVRITKIEIVFTT